MRGIRLLIVPLFALALLAPALSAALGIEQSLYRAAGQPISLDENRTLTPLPAWDVRAALDGRLPRAFEAFWNDHFGWRYTMLRADKSIRRQVLRTGSRSNALIGNDGWLYFTGNQALDYTQHTYPFKEDELNALAEAIRAIDARVRAAGGHYLFVLVPNKHTVYPEHLPGYVRPAPRTRADQLFDRLGEVAPDLDILDLRPVLREQKSDDALLYERTGTHWNDLGAYVGYQALIERIGESLPGVAPLPSDAFKRVSVQEGPFPLAVMLDAGLPPEDMVAFEPGPDLAALRARYRQSYLGEQPTDGMDASRLIRLPFALTDPAASADSTGYSALVFRDSFFSRLFPYVHVHFRTSAYYWQHEIDWAAVEALKPDVVVHEMVERFLMVDMADRLAAEPGAARSDAPTAP